MLSRVFKRRAGRRLKVYLAQRIREEIAAASK
jgi:hypothetical protein